MFITAAVVTGGNAVGHTQALSATIFFSGLWVSGAWPVQGSTKRARATADDLLFWVVLAVAAVGAGVLVCAYVCVWICA